MSEKVIEVKKLSIGYNEYRVISDLSFSIAEGELVGIIGCNGAGKSTLLKTIRGMLPKQSGEVLFYNKQIEAYSERELARKVAYLQQHVEVGFGYSGLDLVMAGRYPYKEWWQGGLNEALGDEVEIDADGDYLLFFTFDSKIPK